MVYVMAKQPLCSPYYSKTNDIYTIEFLKQLGNTAMPGVPLSYVPIHKARVCKTGCKSMNKLHMSHLKKLK